MRRGRTALIIGRTGEARPANHVTDRIDVRHHRLIVLIDGDLTAVVRLDADLLDVDVLGISGSAVGPQQDVGLDLLARSGVDHHAVLEALDPLILLVVPQQHPLLP